ncbi:MAG: hypothetical protein J0M34_01450 [Alphaproteobacteria bacterium]|nr:hypothetical protein [Alphaproteobacteria bacterium]
MADITAGEITYRSVTRDGVDLLIFESGSGAERDVLTIGPGFTGSLVIDGNIIPNADLETVFLHMQDKVRIGEVDTSRANSVEIGRSFLGIQTARTITPTPIEDAYLDSLPGPELRGRTDDRPPAPPAPSNNRRRSRG